MPARYPSYLRVTDPAGRIRLETIRKDEAVRFAQSVYRDEQVTCVIDAIDAIDRSGR